MYLSVWGGVPLDQNLLACDNGKCFVDIRYDTQPGVEAAAAAAAAAAVPQDLCKRLNTLILPIDMQMEG
jgi:hypothetical protein